MIHLRALIGTVFVHFGMGMSFVTDLAYHSNCPWGWGEGLEPSLPLPAAHVVDFPLSHEPDPIVDLPIAVHSRLHAHCRDLGMVDRLPVAMPVVAPASARIGRASACLLVNASGRVARIAAGTGGRATGRLRAVAWGMRFRPAMRAGHAVPAWVELRVPS